MSYAPGATKYCSTCGQVIYAVAEICPRCGVRQHMAGTAGMIQPAQAGHPLLAFLLNLLCVPGIGYLVAGQTGKFLLCFAVSVILAMFTFALSMFVTAPLSAIDAAIVASRARSGKRVGQWDFF